MTTENVLKPCPLCGSTESLTIYNEYSSLGKRLSGVVKCTKNNCPMIVRAESIEEALIKWNRRPEEEFLEEQNEELKTKLHRAILFIEYIERHVELSNDAKELIRKIKE